MCGPAPIRLIFCADGRRLCDRQVAVQIDRPRDRRRRTTEPPFRVKLPMVSVLVPKFSLPELFTVIGTVSEIWLS